MRNRSNGSFAAILGIATALAVAPAAHAAQPFLIDDAEIGNKGDTEIDVLTTATRAASGTTGVVPSVETDYNIDWRLQLHSILPLAYAHMPPRGTQVGVGDIELGIKLRIDGNVEEKDDNRPDDAKPPGPIEVAIAPAVDLPSGDAQRGLGTSRAHVFLPVWVSKRLGNGWQPFGGGGYWINPGTGNRNWWFFGAGVQKTTGALMLGGEVFHSTPATVGAKPATGFDIGLNYTLDYGLDGDHELDDAKNHHHLLLSVGRGARNASTTDRYSVILGYQATF